MDSIAIVMKTHRLRLEYPTNSSWLVWDREREKWVVYDESEEIPQRTHNLAQALRILVGAE